MTAQLLQVEKLQVAFSTRHGTITALHGIDIALAAGETLGIVGESGSGKSVTSLAVMRLLDRAGRITGGICWCVCCKSRDADRPSPAGVPPPLAGQGPDAFAYLIEAR